MIRTASTKIEALLQNTLQRSLLASCHAARPRCRILLLSLYRGQSLTMLAFMCLFMLTTGCGDTPPKNPPSSMTTDQRLALPPDLIRGERLFRACAVCHGRHKGARHRVGPNLFGVYGAKAGQASGFRYSRALKKRDITWDAATLNAYIENPKNVIPGGSMSFGGESNPAHRRDIIAYLKTLQ